MHNSEINDQLLQEEIGLTKYWHLAVSLMLWLACRVSEELREIFFTPLLGLRRRSISSDSSIRDCVGDNPERWDIFGFDGLSQISNQTSLPEDPFADNVPVLLHRATSDPNFKAEYLKSFPNNMSQLENFARMVLFEEKNKKSEEEFVSDMPTLLHQATFNPNFIGDYRKKFPHNMPQLANFARSVLLEEKKGPSVEVVNVKRPILLVRSRSQSW